MLLDADFSRQQVPIGGARFGGRHDRAHPPSCSRGAAAITAPPSRICRDLARPRASPRRQAGCRLYRYTVGSFEITVVTDGVNRFRCRTTLYNVKKDDVKAGLAAAFMDTEVFSILTIRVW